MRPCVMLYCIYCMYTVHRRVKILRLVSSYFLAYGYLICLLDKGKHFTIKNTYYYTVCIYEQKTLFDAKVKITLIVMYLIQLNKKNVV